MENCCGIIGKVFGHKFLDVYDTKVETPKVSEIERLLKNLPSCYVGNPSVRQDYYLGFIESLKSTTTTYVNSRCERCGTLKHAR